jgi:GntR family transcriptional repressor for pyruvate dehydrogenase complex
MPMPRPAVADNPRQPAGLPDRVRRIRTAYEQVYDQLREMIFTGTLTDGHRLPNEVSLAEHFGVSRGTIREALRLLVSEGLLRTSKGTGGGSYVTLPTVDHVSEFLERNIEVLSLTDDVSLDEFLEARQLIEVFAVRQAALRRGDDDLARLRETMSGDDGTRSTYELYLKNKEFHMVLVDVCGNGLLRISAQPIFFVLHTHLVRSTLSPDFPRTVCSEHEVIYARIEAQDPDGAEAAMRQHLEYLAGVYRDIWRTNLAS